MTKDQASLLLLAAMLNEQAHEYTIAGLQEQADATDKKLTEVLELLEKEGM